MDKKAEKYVKMFREVKIASAATVDRDGHPRSRIINIMIAAEEGMYIVTSKGKPFYEQLTETGEIALSAMCPECQSLKFTGKVTIADKRWVDRVFEENPGMNEVYPGDTRYILDAFLIYEGSGEWFDLLHYPISRETFAYGTQEEKTGFIIQRDVCTGCGSCLRVCPQQCITQGQSPYIIEQEHCRPCGVSSGPYIIEQEHCLQCGACLEICPAGAVRRKSGRA